MENLSYLTDTYTEYSLKIQPNTEIHKLLNQIIDFLIKDVKVSSKTISIEISLPQVTESLNLTDFLNIMLANEFESLSMLVFQGDTCILTKNYKLANCELDWELHFNNPDDNPSIVLFLKQ